MRQQLELRILGHVGRPRRKKIDAQELRNLGFIRRTGELFAHLREVGCQRDEADNRRLFFNDYCSYILLYCFNPMIESMTALQELSDTAWLQQNLGVRRFSAGSFSESPAVFDPTLLRPIAAKLAAQARPLTPDRRLGDLRYAVELVDSTLLKVLPGMVCTQRHHKRDGQSYYAWRIHMELQVGMPACRHFVRTGAHGAERAVHKRHLRGGCCYVTDRGYYDVPLFNAVHAAGSRYVCRARENLKYQVLEDRPLSQQQRDAGVISDQLVQIGRAGALPDHPVRLVVVKSEVHPKRTRRGRQLSSGRILLVSDLSAQEASAEVVSLLYQYRWTIELFFRFLKQVLGLRHLISQRPEGIDIQIYCLVIACLLLHLWAGETISKRVVRMVGWYMLGVASLEELMRFLEKQRARCKQSEKQPA